MQKRIAVSFFIFAVIAILIPPPSLYAMAQKDQQQKQKFAEQVGGNTEQFEAWSNELKLTPEQKSKVRAIVDERTKQWEALGKNHSLDAQQKIARMESINNGADQKIEALLTAAQKKKFEALKQRGKPKSNAKKETGK